MKHTPGPWVFNESIPRTVTAPKEGYITRHICDMDASTMSALEQNANARLIAAAPELLDALVDLLPLAEFGAAEQSPPYADDSLLESARAAIAKATGTQE